MHSALDIDLQYIFTDLAWPSSLLFQVVKRLSQHLEDDLLLLPTSSNDGVAAGENDNNSPNAVQDEDSSCYAAEEWNDQTAEHGENTTPAPNQAVSQNIR